MSFSVKLWGVRGSIPSPYTPGYAATKFTKLLKSFCKSDFYEDRDVDGFVEQLEPLKLSGYGGNTTCVEVFTEKSKLILDAGSGLRKLGEEMVKGPAGRGQAEVHIAFTHFHWDHLIGLPFFIPIFIPGNKIHMYAVQEDLEPIIRHVFSKPLFPVPYEALGAEIVFHKLEPRKPFEIGDMKAVPYQLDHPDPCWGFKVESEGKVYSHCVDTEARRVRRDELGPDLPLYQGVDLMVFDSQYTLEEALEKIDWGHAAATVGLDLGIREGIKKIAFVHHDPHADDEKLMSAERDARKYYSYLIDSSKKHGYKYNEVEFFFAVEGMTIEL